MFPQVMQSQAKMAGAMGSTAKTMSAVNQQMKVEDIQKTMMNFEKESTKMDMAGEMSEWNCPTGIWVDPYFMGLSQLEYRLTHAMWAVPLG